MKTRWWQYCIIAGAYALRVAVGLMIGEPWPVTVIELVVTAAYFSIALGERV